MTDNETLSREAAFYVLARPDLGWAEERVRAAARMKEAGLLDHGLPDWCRHDLLQPQEETPVAQ